MVTGDKLFDFDKLVSIGQEQASKRLSKTVGETSKHLKDKIMAIEETGPTALGPAVLTSISMAAEGKPGSTVVICTDGLANIGLGSFDEVKTEE